LFFSSRGEALGIEGVVNLCNLVHFAKLHLNKNKEKKEEKS